MDRAAPAYLWIFFAADLRGAVQFDTICADTRQSMLRIGMRTLNGKARQTAVAALFNIALLPEFETR